MNDLDLNKVQTPEGVMNLLRAAVQQYEADAANLEATAGAMDGRPWRVIAKALETANNSIERGLRKIGYPASSQRRTPLGDAQWSVARYPGDAVRIVDLRKGNEMGSIRIQDQRPVKSPDYNFRVGMYLPGEIQEAPGDTPKVWPERYIETADRGRANALFNQYVADAQSEGWSIYVR